MTNRTHIAIVTRGAFEIVARNLSWVDATNQAMSLEYQVGGEFTSTSCDTKEEYDAWRAAAKNNQCPVQHAWANL